MAVAYTSKMTDYFKRTTSAAPLAVFRIILGLMLLVSIIRFWSKGWIEDLYIRPHYYFPYYNFEFIKPLGQGSYLLFFICGLSALFVAIGLYYRAAIISLFLSFTYIELIDKSTYLNHYYFVSVVCFLLIFLPAHSYFSLDAKRNPQLSATNIPRWCLDSIKVLICILYVYAGLAKINSDWLIRAQPLQTWLPARNDTPLIGWLFNYPWVAFAFSWIGCVYDLCIPFLLWTKKTRLWAYLVVVVFHILTAVLFPIGMFPYIMIGTAAIFFSAEFHQKILSKVGRFLRFKPFNPNPDKVYIYKPATTKILIVVMALFFSFQLIFPLRYLAYPGELFWTEEGYRFSWRVMLMEKAGFTQFVVKDKTGKVQYVNNSDFLTPLQEKMMATQPDMILQFAHILRDHYSQLGFTKPEVYADSYVSLNGRLGRELVDPTVNLAQQSESMQHKPWILPLNDEIQGF